MGAGHGHALHFHGHSVIHRLPAHVKILALLGFVVAVVATPREAFWAHGVHALVLAAAVLASRVPLGYLAKRMVVEVPFVVFAVLMPFIATGPRVPLGYLAKRMVVEVPFVVFAALMPFIATGPRVSVGPFELSEAGLLGAWALLAKGTLGVVASLLLAATTEARDIIAGFEKLRLPQPLVEIMSFMLRYTEVVAGELGRMRIARESRGFRARSIRQWPALGHTMGALFIRSYERGERVHLAMLSRGYAGHLPTLRPLTATGAQWAAGGILPVLAAAVCVTAVVAR